MKQRISPGGILLYIFDKVWNAKDIVCFISEGGDG